MEILIVGLILVALMVYASTRIKKSAAAAFEPELIETNGYSLMKPEGFLHVVDDPQHEVMAYSKDYGLGDNAHLRQATIELDGVQGVSLEAALESIKNSSTRTEIVARNERSALVETNEQANESMLKGFYKLVVRNSAVYRLRFAVLAEHVDDYSRRIDETLDSFTVTSE